MHPKNIFLTTENIDPKSKIEDDNPRHFDLVSIIKSVNIKNPWDVQDLMQSNQHL